MKTALSYWRRDRYCWIRDVYVDSIDAAAVGAADGAADGADADADGVLLMLALLLF